MSSLGGGAEKVLVTMLQSFDYSRYDVDLCLTSPTGIYMKEIPSQVRTFPLFERSGGLEERLGFWLYAKFRISWLERWSARKAIKGHYNTIVSYIQGRPLKFHGYVLDRADRNVTWVHADLYTSRSVIGPVLSERDEKKCYEVMDDVIFVSSEARSQFLKLGYRLKNASVVYNPIPVADIQKFRRTVEFGGGRLVLVLCGRLTYQKAFDRMIRVAERLRKDGCDFVVKIYGAGEDENILQNVINELGLEEVVYLAGFKKPVYPAMSEADIFVSTSRWEGYPTTICEALCLGLPIVATRCCGNTELIGENSENGILTDQDDDAIYDGLKRMMGDDELRKHYSQQSLKKAREFDLSTTMNEIYAHIVDGL